MTSSIPATDKTHKDHPSALREKAVARPVATETNLPARLLADNLLEAALLAQNGKITYANAAATSMLGLSKKILVGKPLHECLLLHARNQTVLFDREGRSGRPRKPDEQENTPSFADQKSVSVRLHPLGSEQASSETLVLLPHAQYGTATAPSSLSMESIPWPVVRIDSCLRYLHGNAAAARLTGSVPAAGSLLVEMGWPSAVCREVEKAMFRLLAEQVAQKLSLFWQNEEERRHFSGELVPELGEDGVAESALLLIRESPEKSEKTAESQLDQVKHAYEKARAAADARDAFFAWVSHELRTPLNGIQSWAHILETYVGASSASPLAMRAMQGIRHGVAQQLRLIEELLDVSRVIEGRLPLSRHFFALTPIARSAVESIRAAADARQIGLDCHYLLDQDALESDPCRVQQTMELLLSHAVNRSPQQGRIQISLHREGRQSVFRVQHACSDMRMTARPQDATSPCRQRPSRQEMDLLLVRGLTELLNGRVSTEPATIEGEIIHTLALPLAASRAVQNAG